MGALIFRISKQVTLKRVYPKKHSQGHINNKNNKYKTTKLGMARLIAITLE